MGKSSRSIMDHELITERLFLRQISLQDELAFSSLLSNDVVIRFCFDALHEIDMKKLFESRLPRWTSNSAHWLCLSIFEKESNNYIGTTGFRAVNSSEVEVGFLLLPIFHGLGYATESLKAVLDYARELGFSQINANVTAGNIECCNVLNKCGFMLVKTEKNTVQVQDNIYDNLEYQKIVG